MPSAAAEAAAPRSVSELLVALADNIPAMIAYWDASLRCRFANRAYLRWFGVSPESLLGTHIRDLLGPLYELNLPYIERVLAGEPQEFERDIPNPAGGPPRQSLAQYFPDVAGGRVRGFFVLVTEVGSVKATERALREAEERLRLTLDEAPIGMALVALDGRFIRVNRALCEIVGYPADELRGMTFQDITHPEDLDTDLALARRLLAGQIPRYQLGKRYIKKDGTVVDVMLHGSLVRGADGSPVHFIAQIEDVTEQKRAESEQRFFAELGPALDRSLDYDKTLAALAGLAVKSFADLCVIDVVGDDDQRVRLLVTARDPAKAALCEGLMQIELARDQPHLLRTVLETRQPLLLPQVTRELLASFAQDAAHRALLEEAQVESLIGVPMVAHGQLLGAVGFVSSSPGRRYGALDLGFAEKLGTRAALALDNARLYRQARRATQARDDVLGVVAHDLRGPLGVISMQAAVLRRHQEPPIPGARASTPADVIDRAASRMTRLIQDLLDVTRIDAKQLRIEAGVVPADALVSDVLDTQRLAARARSVELEADLGRHLPDLWGDRDRLVQVFDNLIANALKFTSAGGVVTVGAAPRMGEVLFWVKDSGAGIAVDDVPHVFDRFWRAEKGTRRGAGLGLPIVKGIVEAHGGAAWVESTLGRGSTFFFTVPVARDRARSAPERGAAAVR